MLVFASVYEKLSALPKTSGVTFEMSVMKVQQKKGCSTHSDSGNVPIIVHQSPLRCAKIEPQYMVVN